VKSWIFSYITAPLPPIEQAGIHDETPSFAANSVRSSAINAKGSGAGIFDTNERAPEPVSA
jgi:hypothetical protein